MAEKKDEQKKKREEDVAVNFGAGTISLGGLFQGIRNVIDLVSKLEEESEEAAKDENGGNGEAQQAREAKNEREFTSPSGRVKAIYGFSVKTSLGGKTLVEPFGNVKRTAKGPVVEEERQPVVDIFDEQNHILIIVELPGIEEGQISTKVNGDVLTLSATNGDRRYYKEVVLPEGIDMETLKRKYTNGILEIRISKK